MLHVGRRPRGFSPPRRFGYRVRARYLATQPDRVRIVSDSLGPLGPGRQRPAGPPPHTSVRGGRRGQACLWTGHPIRRREHLTPSSMRVHPTKNSTHPQGGDITVDSFPLAVGRRGPRRERRCLRQPRLQGLAPGVGPDPGCALPHLDRSPLLPWASDSPPRTTSAMHRCNARLSPAAASRAWLSTAQGTSQRPLTPEANFLRLGHRLSGRWLRHRPETVSVPFRGFRRQRSG
jgi:hypothetical protein